MLQVTVIGAIVIFLYTSRACYNLVVLALSNSSINSFDYDWYNVSDQVNHLEGIVTLGRADHMLYELYVGRHSHFLRLTRLMMW